MENLSENDKKVVKGLIIFFLIAFIIVTVMTIKENSNDNSNNKNETNDSLICSNLANESLINIYKAKNDNAVQARNNYLLKSFNFTAKIKSIDFDELWNEPYLLVVDDYIIVKVNLDKSQYSKAKDLVKDDEIEFCATINTLNGSIGYVMEVDNAIIK